MSTQCVLSRCSGAAVGLLLARARPSAFLAGANLLVGWLGIDIARPGAVVLGWWFCLLVCGTKAQGSPGLVSTTNKGRSWHYCQSTDGQSQVMGSLAIGLGVPTSGAGTLASSLACDTASYQSLVVPELCPSAYG